MIATGGRDRFIQVWDLNEKMERQKGKPIYTVQVSIYNRYNEIFAENYGDL